MPVDLEMLLSASPPLFGYSALADCRFTSYPPFNNSLNKRNNLLNGLTCYKAVNKLPLPPGRSCLAVKNFQASEKDYDEDGIVDSRKKKRVWFADDKGLALVHVRIMAEPSECPPRWTDEFFSQVTRGVRPQVTSENRWEPSFAQPASDYLVFRNKLDKNCVCLENVVVKEEDDRMTGTVKVKNIAFEKEVILRVTFDRWVSSEDVPAAYLPNGMEGTTKYFFDTFSFSVAIPPSAERYGVVEFCVCYRCGGLESWDNNGGVNYRLVLVPTKPTKHEPIRQRFVDAVTADFKEWSSFASWDHLVTDAPYW